MVKNTTDFLLFFLNSSTIIYMCSSHYLKIQIPVVFLLFGNNYHSPNSKKYRIK